MGDRLNAQETGLFPGRKIADAIDNVARAINRLAAAHEAANGSAPTPIGLVIRTELPNEARRAAVDQRERNGE